MVLTLSFSAAGAFDTDELGLAHRLALWCVVGTLMLVQPWLIEYGLARLVPRTRKWRMACLVLAVLLCNLALTFQLHALKSTPLLPKAPDPLIDFYIFLAQAVSPCRPLSTAPLACCWLRGSGPSIRTGGMKL